MANALMRPSTRLHLGCYLSVKLHRRPPAAVVNLLNVTASHVNFES